MQDLIVKMQQKKWWQVTSQELRDEIIHLFKNGYEGFVTELADFPDQIGDTTVLSLHSIAKAKFSLICPVFNVLKGDKQFTYEFAAWKMGSQSGAKGIVFLRHEGVVTHFIILRSWRFTIGKLTYDCVGGFSARGDFSLNDTIRRELAEEMDLTGEMEIHDLGRIHPDGGMTNNHPAVMAVFADYEPKSGVSNKDPYEMSSTVAVFPLEEWRQVVSDNDDGFFAHIMMRAFAAGLITLS